MTPAQSHLLETLKTQIPAAAIVTDRDAIAPWETDWRRHYHGHAPALLQPASTDEVATIVRAAAQHRVALVPQGGNTSMVGGATPPPDGSALIVSLRRMNTLRSLDPAAGLAVAEAGMILQSFNDAALAQDMRFPLTLGGRGSATIGGLVSTNAGGNQVLRFGTMRALVAGIEAVLPDGSVFDGLAALKKDNRGYDMRHLLIGGEGTLGIVTAATLRLVPAITERAAAWIGLADPAAALTLLRRFDAHGDAVESFELMNGALVDLTARHLGVRAPLATPAPWQVLIEAVTQSGGESAAALIEDVLAAALEQGLVSDAAIAASEAQIDAFWKLRDVLPEAQRTTGAVVAHDISVPIAAMPDFMVRQSAAVAARFAGTRVFGFGHLGDGNIHFDAVSPPDVDRERWYQETGPAITRFVNDAVVAAGGSISAEHGIGQMKIAELERLASPARLGSLRAIKAALDPAGLFNPGKLVPLAPPPASP